MKYTFLILFGILSIMGQAQNDLSINPPPFSGAPLTYAHPSVVGLDSAYIHTKVDSIITNGIKQQAFPGAEVLVAKNGKIIFHKTYGFHTYDSIHPNAKGDLYDLASVTKITGPLPALMKLVDEGKLDLDKPFSLYWKPWRKQREKKDITLREILAHQAGFLPFIVFLNDVKKKNGQFKKRFIRNSPSEKFNNQAYEGIYVHDRFKKRMYRKINTSEISKDKKYVYSDLPFLLFPELISQITGMAYEDYLQGNFYTPLGASTFSYTPKTKNFPNAIVPTEIDTFFRKSLTHKWVHDENAALLGGLSGNAGIFATAADLAKIMQLYMQYGIYDGKRYFSETIVKEFTKVQYPENENRRGLGFDKPLFHNSELLLPHSYPAPEVDANSFGHSGFTGTFVWADPKNQLVYILLANRVYPSRTHSKLFGLNIRPAVQQVFYQAGLVD